MASKSKTKTKRRKKDSPRVVAELQNHRIIYKFSSSYRVGVINKVNKAHCWIFDELNIVKGSSLGLKIKWSNIYLIISATAQYTDLLIDTDCDPVHGYLAWYDESEYKIALSYDINDHQKVQFDDDDDEWTTLPNYVEINNIKQPTLIQALSAENTIIYELLNKGKSLKDIVLTKYVIITHENEEKLDESNQCNEDKQNDDNDNKENESNENNNKLNDKQSARIQNKGKTQSKLELYFNVQSASKSKAASVPTFNPNKSTTNKPVIPPKPAKFDQVNQEKIDKKEEMNLSKEQIDNLKEFEVKGFKIKVYNKDIKFIWNDDENKYVRICRNHFFFTETRMDKFDEKYSDFGPKQNDEKQNDESLYCCSSCSEWRNVLLQKKEDLKFSSQTEQKLICGFYLNEKIFRGDTLSKHSKSKNHNEYKQNLINFNLKALDNNFEDIQNKIDSGELPEKLMVYFVVFCCVYFGVKHHHSLRSIIDSKGELAPLIINYFIEKFEKKMEDKTNYVFNELKNKIDHYSIDKKIKEKILKDVDKASDKLCGYLHSLNIHQIPQKYKNTRDIKIMIHSIADVIRFDAWSELSISPIMAPLIDESTSLSNDQRMILYFIYLINADSEPEAVAKYIDIVDCDGTTAVDLMNSMEKCYVKINNFCNSYTEIKKDKKGKKKANDKQEPSANDKKKAKESAKDIINGTDRMKVTKHKTVFFGSDGPTVMQKLARLIKKHWNDILIWLHCIGHKSSLGTKDTNKDEALRKILNELDSFINAVQSFIKNSPKIKEELQAFNDNADEISAKIHFVIRWLTKTESYNNHLNSVPAIIHCFISAAKLTNDDDKRAKLNGWIRKLVNYKNWHRQSIVADALYVVQPLRIKFQKDIQDFCEIEEVLNDAMCDLERLKSNAGKQESRLLFDDNNECEMLECRENNEETRNLWTSTAIYSLRSHDVDNLNKNVFIKDTDRGVQFYGDSTLEQNKGFKNKLIDCTKTSYKERFSNLAEFKSFCIANPKTIKIYLAKHKLPASIQKKGKNHIIKWFLQQTELVKHIEVLFGKWGKYYHLDLGKIKKFEIGPYFYLLYKNRDMNKREFYKLRWNELKRDCFGCALMGRHTLIGPWDACCCERGFSEQNLIITKLRNGILTNLLRDLMMINLDGPDFGTKQFLDIIIRALKVWVVDDRRY